MFNAKKLTEDQIATIKDWAAEGDQLADIQKQLEKEFEIRVTYMDTRFLILDLGIVLISEVEETVEADDDDVSSPDALTEDDLEILPHPPAGGSVSVTVDEIARPGSMVNGRVTFSDGQGGAWYVDGEGRLGVDPDTAGYRPSEPDLIAFQQELQSVMEPQ